MRVVYLIAHLGQTGVNRVVLDLVLQMQAHNHYCSVYYIEDRKAEISYPCEVQLLQTPGQLTGYDVIHAHGLKPELWIAKKFWLGFKRKGFKQANLITTLHCYCFQDFFDLYGKVKGLIMGMTYLFTKFTFDKVVCLSQDMMKYYERWVPKKKLTYAYNTRDIIVEESIITEKEKIELQRIKGNGILIGMNCVLLYRKGLDVMLQAMKLLPEKYHLFVAGDGKEMETFIQIAKEYGVDGRVFFAGRRKEAYRYLPYYDIYAMPSRSEGFPLVLLEAAAYGKKVVASSLPVVTECFADDEVMTFDMPNAKALAQSILNISVDNMIGKRLKEKFEENYAPEAFYHRYLTIYQNMV